MTRLGTPRPNGRRPDILVVDDTPANLTLLVEMLKESGYAARPVPSGKLALQAARAHRPDLVLLDVNMPDMNGYEVCDALKADASLADVPVIFISAHHETQEKVKAFQRGGVDYITKPFRFEEVRARVEIHLELRRKEQQLRQSNEELRELERLRDGLVHMVVHDMRTPLMAVSCFLELLRRRAELSESLEEGASEALKSTATIMELVNSLLEVNKMEAGQLKLNLAAYDMRDLASKAVRNIGPVRSHRELVVHSPDEPVILCCDRELIVRVVQNLLANALRFTAEDEGRLRLTIERCDQAVRVSVRDNGPGIPEDHRGRIFEKFAQFRAPGMREAYSTGLGLAFCKLAVEAHGGSIAVLSEVGQGSTFWFELPADAVLAASCSPACA